MADTTTNTGNKPIWYYDKDNPIIVGSQKCGKKIFNINNDTQRLNAANEIVCRKYLEDINFTHISELKGFEPSAFQEVYNTISSEKIKNNFRYEVGEIDRKLDTLRKTSSELILVIENCETVNNYFNNISEDHINNDDKVIKIIKELFNLVTQMERNYFVHGDLKPQNLLLKKINGKITLVLNDFDSSYVLPGGNLYLKPEPKSYKYVRYTLPAPEIFKKHVKIGYWTDVFVAGLISYQLLNDGLLPEQIQNIFDHSDEKIESMGQEQAQKYLVKTLKSLFRHNKELSFSPPKNGYDSLNAVILSALIIKPEERKKAIEIFKDLEILFPSSTQTSKHPIPQPHTIYTPPIVSPVRKDYELASIAIVALVSIVTCVAIVGIVKIITNENSITSDSSVFSSEETDDHNTLAIYTTTETTPTKTNILTTTSRSEINTNNPIEKHDNDFIVSGNNITGNSGDVNIINRPDNSKTFNNSSQSHSYSSNNYNDNRTEIHNENIIMEPPGESQHNSEIPIEDNSPFIWDKISLDGQYGDIQLYSPIDGIVIRGYKEISNIPSRLEIPTEINGIPVICIDDGAFNNIDTIQEVIIPDSIYQINSNAFSNCQYLWYIEIGANVKIIGSQAFYKEQGCYSDNEPKIVIHIKDFGNLRQYFGDNWAGFNNGYNIVDEYGEEITGVYQ